jgi:D-lactate dehydrogenase
MIVFLKMKDVYFFEAFEEEAGQLRRYLPRWIDAGFTSHTIREHNSGEIPAKIVSIRTQSRIPEEWSEKLLGILTRSTGYDHVLAYKGRTNCGYLPLYCSRAVAEQAMMMWMGLLRNLPKQMQQFSDFHRDNLTGRECKGKSIAVVGMGNIGHEIYSIAKGLDMVPVGVDITEKHKDVVYTTINNVLGYADIIVCAMNLTRDNDSYFNYGRLKKAKRGSIFINIARGEFSPSADLIRLLDEGILGGVGLDVYNKENIVGESFRQGIKEGDPELEAIVELGKRENVILTPHNAFNTHESVERKSRQSIQQIENLLTEGKFLWDVPDE